MRHLNLCIDIDGTITKPHYWLRRANQYFGTNVRPEDVHCYEGYEALGVSAPVYHQFYDDFGDRLHAECEIREGAREIINRLYRLHSVHFVTAREERMRTVSLDWLAKHDIPMDSLTLLGHPNKVQTASELRSDLFLEDSLDNALQLAKAGFEVLLVDCSYNQSPLPPNVTRVNNWTEIEAIIAQRATDLTLVKVAN